MTVIEQQGISIAELTFIAIFATFVSLFILSGLVTMGVISEATAQVVIRTEFGLMIAGLVGIFFDKGSRP
jgi:hypothetical protein